MGLGARVSLPSLADAHRETHDLPALLARGPIVLTFYRGGWCPYCDVSLRALQAVLGDIRALGAELVAVTPETPDHIEATAASAAVDFPLLHDAGNNFARSLGLVFTLPEALRPLYAEIGIDYAFLDADFTRRAEPSDILTALRRLAAAPITHDDKVRGDLSTAPWIAGR